MLRLVRIITFRAGRLLPQFWQTTNVSASDRLWGEGIKILDCQFNVPEAWVYISRRQEKPLTYV